MEKSLVTNIASSVAEGTARSSYPENLNSWAGSCGNTQTLSSLGPKSLRALKVDDQHLEGSPEIKLELVKLFKQGGYVILAPCT